MNPDYVTLDLLRQSHPAWRLLRSDHAPLVASFLQRVFIAPNIRVMAQADLAEALEDELFGLRQRLGAEAFPKPALDYLNDWASAEKGWLRKFYRQGSDEPHFDLTPATEKAIVWLGTLTERSFVGTESRLLTLFELLKQMSEGSETDPQARIAELHKRRDEVDAEISRILSGDIPLLDETALKDRFQQFMALARELLADFREVEHNFRGLDRRVRERIALWDGAKGVLLEEIMGERDTIADSDQGRSFRAFWDFLMSSSRQEELSALLERVLSLPPVAELKPDARTRRVHYDWLEAGEHTQRTVAQLSQQLRRFLDDQAWLENRRIMDILRGIEAKALALREAPPKGEVMSIADTAAGIELPMERRLYTPAIKPLIADIALESGDTEVDAELTMKALYSQVVVDKARLARHIRHALQDRSHVTLRELCVLKGVIYEEGDAGLWNALINLQARVRDYVAVLGLELVFDKAEGYAFLRSRQEPEDDADPKRPRLVARRPLSFPVSLLLALLRRKLAEFDATGGQDGNGVRLVLTRDQIVELIRVFLPESSNEAKLIDQIETHLNKVVELGFAAPAENQRSESR